MREDWQTVKLEDVCSFKGGGTPAKGNESFWGGHIPWVSPKDMKLQFISNSQDKITEKAIQNSSANLLPKDTLLVVVRSSILARTIPLAISRSPLTVNQDLKALLPNPELNVEFLYYALLADKKNLLSKVTRGATVHRLQSESLKNLEVTLPPLPEQERIVSILDKAFEGIDKAIAQTEQNLASARELFESYLNNIFTQKGEDWVEKKLGDVVRFKGGGTPSKANESFWRGSIPWVSPKDMKLRVISDSQDKITEDAIQNSSANLLPENTILIVVRSGILARTIPLGISSCPLTINQDLKALLPNAGLDVQFLYYTLVANEENLLSKVTRGATVHRLQSDSLKNLEVTFPTSKEVQSAILTRIMKQEQLTAKLEALYTQKLNDLKELKQSLLQQAFAGELTKEDAA